jgi:WD40 repeat protein
MSFAKHSSKDVGGYSKMMSEIKWNREGNYLGMISSDKSAKVGQLDKSGSFQNVHSIPTNASFFQLCWNPQDDSRLALCGDDKAVELWDVRGTVPSLFEYAISLFYCILQL